MTSKSDASKEKVFWHEGNFGEWIAFMENYINLCVASRCSFMVYKIPIEKNLNQDIDMCIPDLRTRILELAVERYYKLYSILINHLKEMYKEDLDHDAVFRAYRDYNRFILKIDGENPQKIKIPKTVMEKDYYQKYNLNQNFDLDLIEEGTDDDELPHDGVSQIIDHLMERYSEEYLGLNPKEIMENDTLESIIKNCKLKEMKYVPTFREEEPKYPIKVVYSPMELQLVFSSYSHDTKYFNDAKRSVKDIPESKALQIFNECFSLANRENSRISALIRQGKFYDAFLELRANNEVSTNDTQVEWANKVLTLVFQGEGHDNESLMAFNTRFQKHLRILCIIRSIRTKEKSRKIISYADRITQDANSWTMSSNKISKLKNSDGVAVVEYLSETDRKNWYLEAM